MLASVHSLAKGIILRLVNAAKRRRMTILISLTYLEMVYSSNLEKSFIVYPKAIANKRQVTPMPMNP